LASNNVTHISGVAMGFASTTIATSTVVKILFPNQEEVTRFTDKETPIAFPSFASATMMIKTAANQKVFVQKQFSQVVGKLKSEVSSASSSLKNSSTTNHLALSKNEFQKDARIVTFLRSMFGK
jgi:hypothetical protein